MSTMSLKYISRGWKFSIKKVTELYHEHKAHQSLQTTLYEMTVKETDLVTKNGDLERKTFMISVIK